jgi:hypothetical protein
MVDAADSSFLHPALYLVLPSDSKQYLSTFQPSKQAYVVLGMGNWLIFSYLGNDSALVRGTADLKRSQNASTELIMKYKSLQEYLRQLRGCVACVRWFGSGKESQPPNCFANISFGVECLTENACSA